MKKIIAFILTFAITAISYGANITWNAGKLSTETSGTIYLLQKSSTSTLESSTLISKVIAHLQENGTTSTAEQQANFILVDQEAKATGVHKLTEQRSVGSLDATLSEFFVLYIAEDNTFQIGDLQSTTPVELPATSPKLVWSSWQSGTLGETVPEPTVLALLALGVAGVALRRKKVVA